ncbi:unnamed protein product, partial [Ascophyllum nodosum]
KAWLRGHSPPTRLREKNGSRIYIRFYIHWCPAFSYEPSVCALLFRGSRYICPLRFRSSHSEPRKQAVCLIVLIVCFFLVVDVLFIYFWSHRLDVERHTLALRRLRVLCYPR